MQSNIRKTITISGPVGVGKSTLVKKLKEHYEKEGLIVYVIPEYIEIDGDYALEMLNKRLNNQISPVDFQEYIFETWIKIGQWLSGESSELTKKLGNPTNANIIIFDKMIDDNTFVFSMTNDFTEEESIYLAKKGREIALKYNLPHARMYDALIKLDTHNKYVNEVLEESLDLMHSVDICDKVKKNYLKISFNIDSEVKCFDYQSYWIYLHGEISDYKIRIDHRNRGKETSSYDDDWLEEHTGLYERFIEFGRMNIPLDELVIKIRD